MTTSSGYYRFTYSFWRNLGHLRGALQYFGWLSLDVWRYMLDRDRLRHGDDIHPLEWREWRQRQDAAA